MTSSNESQESRTRVLEVSCNHCGAPLSVPDDARFVTCAHCGSRLEVHHSGGAAFTKVLEQLDQRTAHVETDLAKLQIQEQIDKLDNQWARDREQYMLRDRYGRLSMPSTQAAKTMTGIFGALGVVFLIIGVAIGRPGLD
jgi:ribosomal protein S27E